MNSVALLLTLIATTTALAAPIHSSISFERKELAVPAHVLAEELADRTASAWPTTRNAAGITLHLDKKRAPESFEITQKDDGTLSITAADKLGALFGVGHLLRHLSVENGTANYFGGAHTETPAMAIRGHQLGFRAHANSYDAWDVAQYDQYIRELAFFGTNMIENIPFQDDRQPLNKNISRRDMNRAMSEICQKYGLQYWVWTPADFDLNDRALAEAQLAQYEELYEDCEELTGAFFPGADPGDNPIELVVPYLVELAVPLQKHHPNAKIWVSVQGFSPRACDYLYDWIKRERPRWLGGVIAGPSAPPIQEIRRGLPAEYGVRDYPDITHTVRCQNPVPWWDPAFGMTLGRECISVRPTFFANMLRFFQPFLSGFGTYSDGIHDDLNKIVFSRLGSDPNADVRDILTEYATLFFGADHAAEIADALLALERDWDGSLAENGSVEGTLTRWHALEADVPALTKNWRGQMFLTLAEFNAYTRRRLLNETALEARFNEAALSAGENLDDAKLDALLALLTPQPDPARDALRDSIAARYDSLFHSIGLQSSVEKYGGSGTERGCSLDHLDYPLNNRWWIEDEFKKIKALPLADRPQALRRIATWEDPGPGGYYDALGHPGRSPHVVRALELTVEPDMERAILPTQWWWDNGYSRQRLTWQTSMDWPAALRYDGLQQGAAYTLRLTGFGKAYPVADGVPLEPAIEGTEIGQPKTFVVPRAVTADGRVEITFRRPTDEAHLNWRQQSRASEAWLTIDANRLDK